MKKILNSFILSALLFLIGCTGKSNYVLLESKGKMIPYKKKKVSNSDYIIRPHDRLKVILYADPEQMTMMGAQKLGQDLNPEGILVNSRGYIKLPLISKVKVAGLTQSKAAKKLEKKYSKWFNNPSVYIEAMNKKVFILGEVKKQGVVKMTNDKMTIFEAIAYSGGLTDSAIRNGITIVSRAKRGSGIQKRKIDLTNIDALDESNIILNPGDVVYVKPDKWKVFEVKANKALTPVKATSSAILSTSALKSMVE
jgi:polysaccharide export outer membrane protein